VSTASATGVLRQKAFYSNYGVGVIDVAAPGGDPTQAGPPPFSAPPANLILSTWPAKLFAPTVLCDPVQGPPCPPEAPGTSYYRYAFGTSQAAAHVTGVAALVISRFGDDDTPHNGKLRPGRVAAMIRATADPQPCPPDPACQGGAGYNGYFGHGIVNALRAVTHDTGR
jgi:subtilisin family serine protease